MISADLLDVDLVNTGVHKLAQVGEMTVEVGAADDLLADHLLGDELRGLFEVCRSGKDLSQLAGDPSVSGFNHEVFQPIAAEQLSHCR